MRASTSCTSKRYLQHRRIFPRLLLIGSLLIVPIVPGGGALAARTTGEEPPEGEVEP